MNLIEDIKLDFDDILIVPQSSALSSRKEVQLEVNYKFKHSGKEFKGVPIIATNMSTVGTLGTAKALQDYNMMTWLHKFYTNEEIIDATNEVLDTQLFAVSVGMSEDEEKRFKALYDMGLAKYVNIDVANGYMDAYAQRVYEYRERYPNITIIAGTVCTSEGVARLINSGADIVRVGIGTGGNCITRVKAGVGYPQVSAIYECQEVANKLGGFIVSDGGCKNPGDVAKAFVAGAHFVSLGTMLGAHTENTDEIVDSEGNPWKEYDPTEDRPMFSQGQKYAKVYGMSSRTAMEKYYGKVDDHRTSEGKTSLLPFKGPINNTIQDILGGVRSACTYTNSSTISELFGSTCVRVNRTHNTHFDNYKIGE